MSVFCRLDALADGKLSS